MPESEDRKAAKSRELADSIKEQEKLRELRKFQEEWNKRVEIARDGRSAFEAGDPVESVKHYKKILSLTARRYEVPIEKLTPQIFDPKTRVSESLLISAICFDLAKITDRLKTPAAEKDLRMYLRLFVVFSKGMPFEVVSTSTLRKYAYYSRGIHYPKHFKDTYKALRKGNCFVASAVFEDTQHPEVMLLREFRDHFLSKHYLGRGFIRFYNFVGPGLSVLVERFPHTRPQLRKLLIALNRQINASESK